MTRVKVSDVATVKMHSNLGEHALKDGGILHNVPPLQNAKILHHLQCKTIKIFIALDKSEEPNKATLLTDMILSLTLLNRPMITQRNHCWMTKRTPCC